MSSMIVSDLDQLAQNRLFEGIRADLLTDFASEIHVVGVDAGDVVFRDGDPGDLLYLVGEGSVRISKTGRGGQEETLGLVQAGDFFGEMALFDGRRRTVRATAVEPTILGAIDEPTFERLLELAPTRLHLNFLRLVSERLRNVNAHSVSEAMRAERLNLAGAMANSIIHDLKNPICIIRCCTDLITRESEDARVRELTAMTEKAVDRMLAMTQELHDYSSGSISLTRQTVSIWRLLDELNQDALRLLPGQNIQLSRSICYDGNVVIDLKRFVRVLSNLIRNAREAMPNGGVLTIGTELVENEVIIQISDTGVGIPADLLPRLFEPFVSYGKSHKTGLGLAMARFLVTAHHGTISVKSVEGKGTTIEIRLPAPTVELQA